MTQTSPIRAALYRPGVSGYELIQQPKNQERVDWFRAAVGSLAFDIMGVDTDLLAVYGVGVMADYNRDFTALSVALENRTAALSGPVLVVGLADDGGEASLTADGLALLDAAAREPDAVGLPFFSVGMRAALVGDWDSLTVNGSLPSVLPANRDFVPGAALTMRKRRVAWASSARWAQNTYIGKVGDATVSLDMKLRSTIHEPLFDEWLFHAAKGGGALAPSPEQLASARDHARVFLNANSSNLGRWWDLSNYIDAYRAEMKGTDALSLAAGGLDLDLVVRYAKLGVSDPELVRDAIANDIPDEFISAMW